MNILINIIITIIVSILTCIIYDFVRSYMLTKKLNVLNKDNSWADFWNGNIPIDSDFTDKGDE